MSKEQSVPPRVAGIYLQILEMPRVLWLVLLLFVPIGLCLLYRYPNTVPQSSPKAFLISNDNLPGEWQVSETMGYRLSESYSWASDAERVYLDYLPALQSETEARHTVVSHVALSFAHNDFIDQSNYWFEPKDNKVEWHTSSTIEAALKNADEQRIGCAYNALRGKAGCVILARYGQYLSEFWVETDVTHLSDSNLHNILATIDQRFIEMGVK